MTPKDIAEKSWTLWNNYYKDEDKGSKEILSELEADIEALLLHDVSGRSELLLAFGKFIARDTVNLNYTPDEWVKMFLASNSH